MDECFVCMRQMTRERSGCDTCKNVICGACTLLWAKHAVQIKDSIMLSTTCPYCRACVITDPLSLNDSIMNVLKMKPGLLYNLQGIKFGITAVFTTDAKMTGYRYYVSC